MLQASIHESWLSRGWGQGLEHRTAAWDKKLDHFKIKISQFICTESHIENFIDPLHSRCILNATLQL
jgi:hypothetical protein